MPGPVRPHTPSQSAAILTCMVLIVGGLVGWATGTVPLAVPIGLLAAVLPSAYMEPELYAIPATGAPSHVAEVARWLQNMRKHLFSKDVWWPFQPQTSTWVGHAGGRLSTDTDFFLPAVCGLASMSLPGRLPGLMFIPVYGVVRASLLARRDPPEEDPMVSGPPQVPTPAVGVGGWTGLASFLMAWAPSHKSEQADDDQQAWMKDILAQVANRTQAPPEALDELDDDFDWGPEGAQPNATPGAGEPAKRRLRMPGVAQLGRLHRWAQTWLDDFRQRALESPPGNQQVAIVVFVVVSAIAAVTLAGLQPPLPKAPLAHKYVPVIYNWAVWRLPYWAWILSGAVIAPLTWAAAWAHGQAGPALSEWHRTQAEQQRWFAIWTQLGVPPAELIMDATAYRDRTHVPNTLDIYVFRAAMPAGVDAYCNVKLMPKLANLLQTNNFVVYPASAADAMSGRAIAGLNSPSLFNLVLFKGSMGRFPLAEPVTDKATLMFVARWAIYQAFTAQRLAPPIVHTAEVLHVTHDVVLYEVELFLNPACSVQQVVKARQALRDALGVAWLSISSVHEETHTLSLALGSSPSDIPSSTPLSDDVRLRLVNMQWRDWFQTANVVNSVGETPTICSIAEGYQGTIQLSCQLPAAITLADLQGKAGAICTACNRPYLTLMPGDTPRDVQIIIGDKDPLAEIYFLTDYASEVLLEPGPTPDTTFYAGVGPNGQLVRHDPESVEPHLVVAGASGGGKSTCLHSFILQMAHKNTPEQWQLWLADPKNEMQRYRDAKLPHLRCMIDMGTPVGTESIYATLADMLELLVREMERRYSIFQQMPNRPQKLSQARSDPTFERYAPMPYVSCIVEECADYFIKPTKTSDKELDAERTRSYGRMIFNAELIARKARGAGIYLILATQRPTKESIPMTIKGQSSRIGFKCSAQLDSRIILDQPGLERINIRGQGIVKTGQGLMTFKSFLPRMPDENHPDWPNDIDDIVRKVVERDGVAHDIITHPGMVLAQMGDIGAPSGETVAPDPTPFWEQAGVAATSD